ncbi:MAG: histidine kinase [Flavobacteriales bacterium]|nr:MAG: histidine kinase [Flavobacteriales bacterium]
MISIKKHITPIIIVGFSIYLFDQGLNWISGKTIGTFNQELEKIAYYFLYSMVIGLANFWLVIKLDQKFSWEYLPKKRAIYGIIGGVIVTLISIVFLRAFISTTIEKQSIEEFIAGEKVRYYVFPFLISIIVILAFYTINFYQALNKRKIKQHQVVAETEIAKYESLKSQLDPHFLFNSLNVLTALIDENPKQAEQFTTKLSQVYRYVVEQKDKDLVSLEEELHFAKIYMGLLKMRFEEALRFTLPEETIPENYKIVPLSLQLLLENAIKHNIVSDDKPLNIAITIEDHELIISNNYNPKQTLKKGVGVGLKNIRERYNLISYRQPTFQKTEDTFVAKLPLLTQKISIMNTQNQQNTRYNDAKKHVEEIREFYQHLIVFIVIMSFLILVNYLSSWDYKWFIFPLFGWGIGLFFHFLNTFKPHWFLSKKWEERKIKEFMEEDNKWQ